MSIAENYNLTSPGFPNGYAQNLQCEWIFSTSPGYHLGILFTNVKLNSDENPYSFEVVRIASRANELEDWKSVYELTSQNSTHQAAYASTMMKVTFNTDYAGNGTGFMASIVRSKYLFRSFAILIISLNK